MALNAEDVVAGEYFLTPDRQLRKVVRVVRGDHGAAHVWYQCKSATVPNSPFLFGHTQANPPTLDEFVAQCERRLSWVEIRQLCETGILLTHE